MPQLRAPQLWQVPTTSALEQEQLQPLVAQLHSDLQGLSQRFRKVVLANSLAVEDLVLTDAIAHLGLPVQVVVLNTGKLHAPTLAYLHTVQELYPQLEFQVFYPKTTELEAWAQTYEFAEIYQSLSARKACCYARKIEPLGRALAGQEAWITGQRREQAATRTSLEVEEFDAVHQLVKFNPLAAWTQPQVWAYVQRHKLPVNPLYHQGIPSIGCEPCTKPIRAHEDLRAGRWWWENQDSKECGLHQN